MSTKLSLSGGIESKVALLHSKVVRVMSSSRLIFLRQLWVRPLIAIVILGIISWFLGRALEQVLKQDLASKLTTILAADVTALKIWMTSQEQTATSAAADHAFAELVDSLFAKDFATTATSLELMQAPQQPEIESKLKPFLEAHGYHGYLILTPNYRIISSQRPELIGLVREDETTRSAVDKSLNGTSSVTRPHKSSVLLPDANERLRAGVPTMFAVAPIRNSSGKVIAALALRIKPEKEFTQILSIARPGESGETYAVDRTGLLISQSRFDADLQQWGLLNADTESILNVQIRDPGVDLTTGRRPKLLRSEQPFTHIAEEIMHGRNGVDVEGFRDYRGVPSIGAWIWLEEFGFGVATEMDRAEAYKPLVVLRTAFWILVGLLVLLAIALSIFSALLARLNQVAQQAVLEAKQLGQYTLDEKIGEGGMGVVYRAHHAMLQRPTAVKLLNPERSSISTLARFEREVQLTSQLNHPNTIAVYDFGRTPEGVFYYAMEYLDGINLEELVKRQGELPDGRVISILRQICGSLAEAHELGLVHRDIKPANIVLNLRGGIGDFVKVLDFGLARAVDNEQQQRVTAAGVLVGTPLYLSPEAISYPDQVDARSDIYAVGAVAYYLLTGQPVFDGATVMAILRQHANTMPRAPSETLGKPVNAELEQLILQCLAKNPAARPASARQMQEVLARCRPSNAWTETDALQWWQTFQSPPGVTITAGSTSALQLEVTSFYPRDPVVFTATPDSQATTVANSVAHQSPENPTER
jgi:serine/threonine protein kinase